MLFHFDVITHTDLRRANRLRARNTTFSTVKPYRHSRISALSDAPKRSTPGMSPPSPSVHPVAVLHARVRACYRESRTGAHAASPVVLLLDPLHAPPVASRGPRKCLAYWMNRSRCLYARGSALAAPQRPRACMHRDDDHRCTLATSVFACAPTRHLPPRSLRVDSRRRRQKIFDYFSGVAGKRRCRAERSDWVEWTQPPTALIRRTPMRW